MSIKSTLFGRASSTQVDTALLVLRIVLGVIFIAHGAQKVFTFGFAGVSGGFAQMGIPMANVMGPFIGLLELVGGAALIVGLLTRLVSLGLVFDMLGAMFFVHLKAGFFSPNGYEFVLMLATAALALVIAGAGRYSIDNILAGGTDDRTRI